MARKKRAASRGKRKKTSSRRRKGRWATVTFEELDAWRSKNGIPKNRMASMLGVTNSTYHNWARGVSTPTPKTQERIRGVIDQAGGASGLASAHPTAPAGESSPRDVAVLEATGLIVEGFLKSKTTRLTPEKLNTLIREVRRALIS